MTRRKFKKRRRRTTAGGWGASPKFDERRRHTTSNPKFFESGSPWSGPGFFGSVWRSFLLPSTSNTRLVFRLACRRINPA